MKNALIALGLTLAASTAAYADSGALDVLQAPSAFATGAVAAPIATGATNAYEQRARLGDGSPVYQTSGAGVDYTATASVSGADQAPRLGDGSPVYFN